MLLTTCRPSRVRRTARADRRRRSRGTRAPGTADGWDHVARWGEPGLELHRCLRRRTRLVRGGGCPLAIGRNRDRALRHVRAATQLPAQPGRLAEQPLDVPLRRSDARCPRPTSIGSAFQQLRSSAPTRHRPPPAATAQGNGDPVRLPPARRHVARARDGWQRDSTMPSPSAATRSANAPCRRSMNSGGPWRRSNDSPEFVEAPTDPQRPEPPCARPLRTSAGGSPAGVKLAFAFADAVPELAEPAPEAATGSRQAFEVEER